MEIPTRRRRRPLAACTECRRRKIRCDRATPCGPCSKSVLPCVYSHVLPESHANVYSEPPSSLAGISHSTLQTLFGSPPAITDLPSPRDYFVLPTATEAPIAMAADHPPGPTISSIASCDPLASPFFWRTPTESLSGSEHQFTEAAVLGTSHWEKELDRFEQLQFLRHAPHDLGPEFQNLRPLLERSRELEKERVALNRPIDIASCVDCRCMVPDRGTCDRLVDLYMTTFESVVRIVHVPSFLQDCRQYWQDPQSVSDSVVWKLLLAMAVGVFVCPGSTALQSDAAAWILGGHRWLTHRSVESAQFDLNTLQISCLLFVNGQTSRVGSKPVWLLKETLICMAMKLGLHQEPSTHFPNMSPSEAEMRRRLWATVLEIAIQSSFESGLPPLISSEGYDCTPPSNLDDADLLGNESLAPQPLTVFTQSTVSTMLAKTQRIRLRILHLVNAPGTSLTYQDALELAMELHSIINANLTHIQSLTPSSTGPTDFHFKILDVCTRRFLLALHTPFAGQPKANPYYYYSRKVRIEAAALLLTHHVPQLDDHTVADNHYTELLLWGDGFFTNALRHAASTLCLDLVDSITENAFPMTDRGSHDHLYQVIQDAIAIFERRALRNPSTHNDYVFFSCATAQIQAMRANKPINTAIYQAAERSLDRCCAALEAGRGSRGERISLPLSPSGSDDPCLFPSANDPDFGFWNDFIARRQFTR
ncbi:hypothetical protein N7495_001752 [Penicillium taxi]|uniref:uncharacterized protein n=1 Tax=Penicillium taxi TaxID=168475 RepID=UPI002544FD6E|nr:uncharacterized protein N7495_001752 [Penicillium taxi]KAJ5909070.1 hypothetical protein N7495_001752 [Penicillium taxi]